jgi:hypothetical protein
MSIKNFLITFRFYLFELNGLVEYMHKTHKIAV